MLDGVGRLVVCLFGRKHHVWSRESRADGSGPISGGVYLSNIHKASDPPIILHTAAHRSTSCIESNVYISLSLHRAFYL